MGEKVGVKEGFEKKLMTGMWKEREMKMAKRSNALKVEGKGGEKNEKAT